MKPIALVISCEHATNYIPKIYEHYFSEHQALLQTHRGIDIGAKEIAEHLGHTLNCDLELAMTSRLLIDCNRSLTHPQCFSEISAKFSTEEKNQLIQAYYLPFRLQVENYIHAHLNRGYQVWHLSIHSFTPTDGTVRNADIGLLYDPKRSTEKAIAQKWQSLLKVHGKYRRVRMNYPYKGTSDGFTTRLRKQFSENVYVGIEVESNQALTREPLSLAMLSTTYETTLKMVMRGMSI